MGSQPPRSFTLYCTVLFVIAVGVAVALLVVGESPPIQQVLVLGCLFVIVDNMDVDVGEQMGLSASLMIPIASIVLFQASAPGLGPLLVGMCAGAYLDHVRTGDWRKIMFNSANFGLAALIAD